MKFKQLTIGSEFNFDHSDLKFALDIAKGPWVKTSNRRYIHKSDVGNPNFKDRTNHHQVGTINTEVIPS